MDDRISVLQSTKTSFPFCPWKMLTIVKTTFALAMPFMFQFVEGSFALKQWKFLYAMRSDDPNCIQETEVLFALIIDSPLCI